MFKTQDLAKDVVQKFDGDLSDILEPRLITLLAYTPEGQILVEARGRGVGSKQRKDSRHLICPGGPWMAPPSISVVPRVPVFDSST